MNLSLLTGLAACGFYLASLTAHLFALNDSEHRQRTLVRGLWAGLPALLLHLGATIIPLMQGGQPDFSLFKAGSAFFLVLSALVWTASWRWPMSNLLLIIYPLSVVSILVASFIPLNPKSDVALNWGIGLHILCSILSYSILTIAAVQAAALSLLIRQLKQRRFSGIVDIMPPLQTMEDLLFRLIWTGEILLALAIFSGALFLDNIFAQHLVHKTVLSIVAWLVFAILLWGRHQQGWRGLTAIRWTLSGFGLMILAYFGSKFVLEVLL